MMFAYQLDSFFNEKTMIFWKIIHFQALKNSYHFAQKT
jgi:hypothetical protein